MEIKATAPHAPAPPGQARPEPEALRIGQQLTAHVVAVKHDKQTLTLRLGEQKIELRGDRPLYALRNGEELVLKVVNSRPYLAFRIVGQTQRLAGTLLQQANPDPFPRPGDPATLSNTVIETVRRYLPIQDSATGLLNSLSRLESESSLPEGLLRLAREILQNLPQGPQLADAERLKRHIDNAGHHLEARLALFGIRPDLNLSDDFKLKLLRLIEMLQHHHDTHPPRTTDGQERIPFDDILRKSQSALAKIVLEQLASLPKDDGNRLVWILELPFFDGRQANGIALRIEREKTGKQAKTGGDWSVMLEMNPPGLGTIYCNLFSREGILATRFWSERETTAAMLQRHIDLLRDRLLGSGIKPGIIEVQMGPPPSNATARTNRHNIFDENA